ncbi:MAG: FHA domain-containing protein [Anaerolineales bacterium]|nr:FHA domain-containing protein [Anaerolineales bacterium]
MRRSHFIFICALLLLLGVPVAFAQNDAVTITAVHSTNFPTVTVDFILDTAVPAPQSPASYSLTEDGQPVDIQSIEPVEHRQPISLLIVVDQGRYSVSRYRQNYDLVELKQLFYTLGEDFFQEGDQIGILTGRWDEGTNGRFQIQPHLELTNDFMAYTQAIDTLDIDLTANDISLDSVQAIETPLLLEPAIEQMNGEPNGVILYLSALIHAPNEPGPTRALNAAERLAADAQAANLQLVVFQAAANTIDDDIRAPMNNLAGENLYIELKTSVDNLREVTTVYQTLWQDETSYTATYRSRSASSQPRTVSLALATAPDQADEETYTVTPQPPVLLDEEVTWAEDGRYQLTATLNWPDLLPRELSAVQINSQTVTDFTVSESQLTATFTASTDHFAQMAITDELGLNSSSELTLPDPPSISATAVATTEPEESTTTQTAPAAPGTQLLRWLPWLGLLIALGYIGIFQRQKLPQVGRQVRHTARRLTTIVAGNARQPVIAHLHIAAAREDLINETIDLITDITTLGRDPQLSDIQLYAEDERSSISGQHCTIQFDQGCFHITDNGSANGTAVNGNLLPADDPYPLNDGDEIQLGHKARRGATLRFTVAEAVKRQQRATIADANFPGSAQAGTPTQIDLEPAQNNLTAAPDRLPVPEDDDDTWWKKLE